jgi:hypothetical protein
MEGYRFSPVLSYLLLAGCFMGCNGSARQSYDYLLKVCDSNFEACGYSDPKDSMVIPPGKYRICFTDTFRTYAIVSKGDSGIVAIDRQENILYQVFLFDNGPDESSEGLFRIIVNHKIGYAESATGRVIIKPQFDCAWPFVDGSAKVSTDCQSSSDGEHTTWLSDHWYYIDRSGNKVNNPKIKIE